MFVLQDASALPDVSASSVPLSPWDDVPRDVPVTGSSGGPVFPGCHTTFQGED
jgi:hypothetical protein